MTIIFQARPPKCRCCSPSRTLWISPWRRTPRPSSSVKTLASEVSSGQISSQVFVPFGFIRCQHNTEGSTFSGWKIGWSASEKLLRKTSWLRRSFLFCLVEAGILVALTLEPIQVPHKHYLGYVGMTRSQMILYYALEKDKYRSKQFLLMCSWASV